MSKLRQLVINDLELSDKFNSLQYIENRMDDFKLFYFLIQGVLNSNLKL
jgi:hypothetical protein